uniref:Adipocyte plasma membrane-associated protein n=1 Tax=Timema tahoe TaxID=61484 RepID=A0A7R9FID5_9NEOP|nr:unnamed protein product [Timema tahoe]
MKNKALGASTLLVSKNVAINGKEPRLPNSVDVAKDGTVYWTDSSTDVLLQDGLYALLGDGSGRYYLKGPKKGQKDIFLDGLPGLPDNLKSNGRGGFYVPLIVGRDMNHTILTQQLAPYPTVRKFLARVFALLELSFQQVEALVPNYYTQRAIHWLGHFESISSINMNRFTVLDVDIEGRITDSLHCLDGSLKDISEIEMYNGHFYFGSPYNDFIGRVKIN